MIDDIKIRHLIDTQTSYADMTDEEIESVVIYRAAIEYKIAKLQQAGKQAEIKAAEQMQEAKTNRDEAFNKFYEKINEIKKVETEE